MTGAEHKAARRALGYYTAGQWAARICCTAGAPDAVSVHTIRKWDAHGPSPLGLALLRYEEWVQRLHDLIRRGDAA